MKNNRKMFQISKQNTLGHGQESASETSTAETEVLVDEKTVKSSEHVVQKESPKMPETLNRQGELVVTVDRLCDETQSISSTVPPTLINALAKKIYKARPDGKHIPKTSEKVQKKVVKDPLYTNPRNDAPSTAATSIPDFGIADHDRPIREATQYGTPLAIFKNSKSFSEKAYEHIPKVLLGTPTNNSGNFSLEGASLKRKK